VTTPKKPAPVRVQRAAPILDDDAPSENYALRLTEALEAISSVEGGRKGFAPPSPPPSPSGRGSFIFNLPPVRLPIGPAIPWRVALPALIAVVAVMMVMSRPSGPADAQGVRLPTPEPYAVQLEAPLFTNAQAAQAQAPAAAPTPAALGVPDASSVGFDVVDIAFKLVAVLALAYGSLFLLKRVGVGGGGAARTGGAPGMRVVSSLALAPNRTVHVLKVPGGKTLLVGATPNQVNLIADLGDLPEAETPEATSFFDVLKGKL